MKTQLVGSANAAVGSPTGMTAMRAGVRALDAVIATISEVEANPEGHLLGYGGSFNLLGGVELDASSMAGRDLRADAVDAAPATRSCSLAG